MTMVLVSLLVASVGIYLASRLNFRVGAALNFALGIFLMIYFWNLNVPTMDELGTFLGQKMFFKWTDLGMFFTEVSLIVIVSVMFFSIKWLDSFKYPHAFNMLLLMMTIGSIGVFAAGDLITLYVFWEIAVLSSLLIVPMGKKESRKAAIVYAVMSAIGTYMYLYASFMMYSRYGSLSIEKLSKALEMEGNVAFKTAVFLLLVAAGIAKSGVFPLHTWLRIAHGNAPDAFSAVLSGQLVKMGSYVVALTTAVFPSLKMFAQNVVYSGMPIQNYVLIGLGATSIVIGTLMAIKQDDMKMLIAFSTVANSGYIMIGIATMDTVGFAGGLFHVFNHALAAAMIFLAFASVVYRTHTTKISELGGLIHRMPITYIVYLMAIISLAGIPPMSGFISKWMIFQSLVRKGMFVTAFFTFFGSIGSFLYVFRPLAGVFLGQLPRKYESVKEVPWIMTLPMVVLMLLSFLMGVYPYPVLKPIAAIEESLGIKPIEFTHTTIKGFSGSWNTVLVFNLFMTGFIVAYILYTLFPRPKKVDLMDTYTAGEFIYTPELYHYSSKFYAGIERMYEKHPSWERLTEMLAKFFHDVGEWIHSWFFRASPSVYTFWAILVLIIVFWVRW